MLACYFPKLQSFKFLLALTLVSRYTHLFESYSKAPGVSVHYRSRYTCTMFGRLLLPNRAAANGHGGSPSHLCQHVAALVVGRLLSRLHRSEVRQWGLSECT